MQTRLANIEGKPGKWETPDYIETGAHLGRIKYLVDMVDLTPIILAIITIIGALVTYKLIPLDTDSNHGRSI